MADKASRGLVIFGDGLMSNISSSHSHIHKLASLASCGFLALRDSPLLSKNSDERGVSELAQLWDAYDYVIKNGQHLTANADSEVQEGLQVPDISKRFMGLKAAMYTTCSSAKSLGRALGFNILQCNELMKTGHSPTDFEELPDTSTTALELLRLLGFSEGHILEESEYDLVFVHIRAFDKVLSPNSNEFTSKVEWINAFTGEIMKIAQPGSKIASRLHFSLVMSYRVQNEDVSSFSLVSSKGTDSNISSLVPHQSYTMKGGNLLDDIRHHHPMLVAQWQDAVTRKDMAQAFCFKEFQELGGNLAILADRFLYELAFKLWKAPKYGA